MIVIFFLSKIFFLSGFFLTNAYTLKSIHVHTILTSPTHLNTHCKFTAKADNGSISYVSFRNILSTLEKIDVLPTCVLIVGWGA